jgi:hypothetical protein
MWQYCGMLNFPPNKRKATSSNNLSSSPCGKSVGHKVDSLQIEERLQTQVAYQAPHVVEVWASESSLKTKERLRAQTTYQTPHVATMRTMESEEKCGQRLCDQTAYQVKQRAPFFEQGVHEDLGKWTLFVIIMELYIGYL